ncbi:hypothetical protein FVE85_9141 [Porphyridium purpureum]|uniref:Uncharacterized protein n=1 Tax=Porphyridium purpureum TaxID=35688 RepID=A0A5J4YN44_PORPP|nr:hypothetical protein FVE85_9141 [Porphyridium purpureum]|eukprot:POR6382..scf222_8
MRTDCENEISRTPTQRVPEESPPHEKADLLATEKAFREGLRKARIGLRAESLGCMSDTVPAMGERSSESSMVCHETVADRT